MQRSGFQSPQPALLTNSLISDMGFILFHTTVIWISSPAYQSQVFHISSLWTATPWLPLTTSRRSHLPFQQHSPSTGRWNPRNFVLALEKCTYGQEVRAESSAWAHPVTRNALHLVQRTDSQGTTREAKSWNLSLSWSTTPVLAGSYLVTVLAGS